MTSDPYAFVLQKRAPKPAQSSTQGFADVFLKSSNSSKKILDDEEVRVTHSSITQ